MTNVKLLLVSNWLPTDLLGTSAKKKFGAHMLEAILVTCFLLLVLPQANAAGPAKLEVELFTVYDKHLHPPQITRPAGPFVLLVRSETNQRGLVVNVTPHGLTPSATNSVKQVSLDAWNGNYYEVLNLSSGVFDVTIPGQTALHATITIK